MKNFPSHLIDNAFMEAFKNYKTCIETYYKTGKPFTLKYKKKKNKFQTMNIESLMIGKAYSSIFTNLKYKGKFIFRNLQMSENFSNIKFQGSTLTWNKRTNEWYLNLAYTVKKEEIEKKRKNIAKRDNICAVDPGIRKFATVYSPRMAGFIGYRCMPRLEKVCKEIDIINSRMRGRYYYNKNPITREREYYVNNSKRRYRLRRAMHRKIKKCQNMIRELHWKTAKYLCRNYKKVVTSPFSAKEMSKILKGKLARAMYTLSYYKFRERLKSKGEEYGTEIIIKSEAYTSKTCPVCGKINYKLGTNETFKCNGYKSCGLKMDRDFVGSVGGMLRNHRYV